MNNIIYNNSIKLIVPPKYEYVYKELLLKIVNTDMISIDQFIASKDCDNKKLIKCWQIFQSACACYTLGFLSKAEYLLNYVIYNMSITFPDVPPVKRGFPYKFPMVLS